MNLITYKPVSNLPMSSLYIGDLDFDTTENMICEKFSFIGQVLSVHICRDRTTGLSFRYGYVNFVMPADAERAFYTMNGDIINGHPIRLAWPRYNPAYSTANSSKIFVRNLEKNITANLIYNTFSMAGNVFHCNIVTDRNGESKGYGFVHFETQASAQASIIMFNGMIWCSKRIYVSQFIPRHHFRNEQ